jgi:hypothetical protein
VWNVSLLALAVVPVALGGCRGGGGGTAQCDLKPARTLHDEGRLEHAVTALRELAVRCPDDGEVEKLRASVEAELRAPGDPLVLIREGLQARAAKDEKTARAKFDRARALAERDGAVAELVKGGAYLVERSRGRHTAGEQPELPWTRDGRYLVLLRVEGLAVLDTQTHVITHIDGADDPVLSPSSTHLAARKGDKLVAIELATGRTVIADRTTTLPPRYAPDGRLVFADTTNTDDVVHLFDLATGKDTELRAARPPGGGKGIAVVAFDIGGRVPGAIAAQSLGVAPSPGLLHIWREQAGWLGSHPASSTIVAQPVFVDELVAYVGMDKANARVVRVADFGIHTRTPHPQPQPRSTHPACGNGRLDDTSPMLQCGPATFVVAFEYTACEWDVRAGKLLRTWPTGGHPQPMCDKRQRSWPKPNPMDWEDDLLALSAISVEMSGTHTVQLVLGTVGAAVKLADSDLATMTTIAPTGDRVAAIVYPSESFASAPKTDRGTNDYYDRSSPGGRVRLWDARGQITWTSPEPVDRAACRVGAVTYPVELCEGRRQSTD